MYLVKISPGAGEDLGESIAARLILKRWQMEALKIENSNGRNTGFQKT
jgi:hypothetical protein